jgi:hypothetical protein
MKTYAEALSPSNILRLYVKNTHIIYILVKFNIFVVMYCVIIVYVSKPCEKIDDILATRYML